MTPILPSSLQLALRNSAYAGIIDVTDFELHPDFRAIVFTLTADLLGSAQNKGLLAMFIETLVQFEGMYDMVLIAEDWSSREALESALNEISCTKEDQDLGTNYLPYSQKNPNAVLDRYCGQFGNKSEGEGYPRRKMLDFFNAVVYNNEETSDVELRRRAAAAVGHAEVKCVALESTQAGRRGSSSAINRFVGR